MPGVNELSENALSVWVEFSLSQVTVPHSADVLPMPSTVTQHTAFSYTCPTYLPTTQKPYWHTETEGIITKNKAVS